VPRRRRRRHQHAGGSNSTSAEASAAGAGPSVPAEDGGDVPDAARPGGGGSRCSKDLLLGAPGEVGRAVPGVHVPIQVDGIDDEEAPPKKRPRLNSSRAPSDGEVAAPPAGSSAAPTGGASSSSSRSLQTSLLDVLDQFPNPGSARSSSSGAPVLVAGSTASGSRGAAAASGSKRPAGAGTPDVASAAPPGPRKPQAHPPKAVQEHRAKARATAVKGAMSNEKKKS
jgi:hypothetical protein